MLRAIRQGVVSKYSTDMQVEQESCALSVFFKSLYKIEGGGNIAECTAECDSIARSMRCCVDIICRPSGETGNCLAGIQEQQSKLFCLFLVGQFFL